MTEQDNILRLAREAGLTTDSGHWRGIAGFSLKYSVEKFAALVKADAVAETLEACAKLCDQAAVQSAEVSKKMVNSGEIGPSLVAAGGQRQAKNLAEFFRDMGGKT